MTSKLAVPLDSSLVGELFLRVGTDVDVTAWIENVLADYLERTCDDDGWREEYYSHVTTERGRRAQGHEFGDPTEGYVWQSVFLLNGTRLRMTFKRQQHFAIVKHCSLDFEGSAFASPSELASHIAGGTSRNAWRDFWVKRPSDPQFIPADSLRMKAMQSVVDGNAASAARQSRCSSPMDRSGMTAAVVQPAS